MLLQTRKANAQELPWKDKEFTQQGKAIELPPLMRKKPFLG
jgi:hypothetical protein